MTVTVYVDVLIILNAFVNFFILLAEEALSGERVRALRIALAAFTGSLFSLAVFLDSYGILFELLLRLACSTVTVLVCFGFGGLGRFIRLTGVFYAVSFTYAGIMLAMKFMFNPEALGIHNGVVYIGISPLVLVIATLVSYLILTVIRLIARRNGAGGKIITLSAELGERSVSLRALIDTGHDVRDVLTGSPVIITESSKLRELLGDEEYSGFKSGGESASQLLTLRYRLMPIRTVGGSTVLPALRIDRLRIGDSDRMYTVDSPLLAESTASFGGAYTAVAGTDIVRENVI